MDRINERRTDDMGAVHEDRRQVQPFEIRHYMPIQEEERIRLPEEYRQRYRNADVHDGMQIIRNRENHYEEVPASEGILSASEEVTCLCCGQKQNEQILKAELARLSGLVAGNADAGDLTGLIRNKKWGGGASGYYMDVLDAAKHFYFQLQRGDLEADQLIRKAFTLYFACDAYLAARTSPKTERGRARKEHVGSIKNRIRAFLYGSEGGLAAFAGWKNERGVQAESAFFSDNVMDRRGDERWTALDWAIRAAIWTWSADEEMEAGEALVASLKKQMIAGQEQKENILMYFFPELDVVRRRNKEEQKKVLAGMGEAQLKARMEKIVSAIGETMGDIAFWGSKLAAESVKELKMTGSDLHERGLGVTIVTYRLPGGQDEKKVIKPDKKLAEYLLLSTGTGSIAEQLNHMADRGDIYVADKAGKRISSVQGHVRTLQMSVDDAHGTMTEYVEHVQKDELFRELPGPDETGSTDMARQIREAARQGMIRRQVDSGQALITQIFCALVGMSDMHHENLVYEQAGQQYQMAMIDADNAFSMEKFWEESAGSQSGMVKNYMEGQDIRIDRMDVLMTNIVKRFSDPRITCRVVPVKTTHLSEIRGELQKKAEMSGWLEWMRMADPELFLYMYRVEKSINRLLNNKKSPEYADYVRRLGEDCGISEEQAGEWSRGIGECMEEKRSDVCERKIWGLIERLTGKGLKGPLTDEPLYYYFLNLLYHGDATFGGFERVLENVTWTGAHLKEALRCAQKDFMNGQIPFYEYHPADGTVTTHGDHVVAQAKSVGELFGLRPHDGE